jgi:hypothetical protein
VTQSARATNEVSSLILEVFTVGGADPGIPPIMEYRCTVERVAYSWFQCMVNGLSHFTLEHFCSQVSLYLGVEHWGRANAPRQL